MSEKVVARNKEHLKQLITKTIEKEGADCDLNFIDVSNVTDMSELFYFSGFNGDISNWNVSNVTKMKDMFLNNPLEKNPPKWYTDKDD